MLVTSGVVCILVLKFPSIIAVCMLTVDNIGSCNTVSGLNKCSAIRKEQNSLFFIRQMISFFLNLCLHEHPLRTLCAKATNLYSFPSHLTCGYLVSIICGHPCIPLSWLMLMEFYVSFTVHGRRYEILQ